MKHTLISLLVAGSLIVSCGPTTYETESSNAAYLDVPGGIQQSFTTQYPSATNVTWGLYDPSVVLIDWDLTGWPVMDADDYAVTFVQDGETYYAWYDVDGNWIGSAYTIRDHTTLPTAISAMLQNKYTGYTIEKVEKEMWKDQVAYELRIVSGDSRLKLLVDSNGNVIKEKTK